MIRLAQDLPRYHLAKVSLPMEIYVSTAKALGVGHEQRTIVKSPVDP
jgi:hypothetical protein